ncbi:MAG: methyltransferase domain-containing protein [Planctomycetota bacterium]|nr:methyltransferase domain-containing protein [Planctomycetota bacterium]
MKVAVLVASRNRPDLVDAMARSLAQSMTLPYDLFVVECGTDKDKLSEHSTLWYPDPQFRGKLFGHSLALDAARKSGKYDYYFVLMNDVTFEPGVDPARTLIEQLEREPRMAILSPTNADGGYPGATREARAGWRAVTTCDYLGFMMKAAALDEVGFLNPEFQYCWGAIHELSYKLYSAGWFVAYSDEISYRHLGGSTYGQKGTNTISREEYQQRAKRFAYEYFRRNYGDNWNEVFLAATRPHAIAVDTFTQHKQLWSSAFTPEKLAELGGNDPRAGLALEKRMQPLATPGAKRLHLGCGPEKRDGWINVDTQAAVNPDIVASVDSLPMFADGSVDVIEANHLFEHLTYDSALAALKEWARVLKPGAELYLEMPDFDACVRMVGKYKDDRGYDVGMIGLYGWPPAIATEGIPQIHKWGWSRTELGRVLREAGFGSVEFGPITQTWRVAAKVGRDLRLRAVRGVPSGSKLSETKPMNHSSTLRPHSPSAPAPLPAQRFELATEASVLVFAWPNWNDSTELEFLFNAFGRHLVGRKDACLCLRRDPALDPPPAFVREQLVAAYVRALGAIAELEVLVVDDEFGPDSLRNLASTITCALELPSSTKAERAKLCASLGNKLVKSVKAFVAATGGHDETAPAQYSREVLDRVNWQLVEEIKALHPWNHPVVLGNLRVTPGAGSNVSPLAIETLTTCRAQLLVEGVAQRIDLRGKSVLELGCDCGFWSARLAEQGATKVVGVDSEARHVAQAKLYWQANGFLPQGAWNFEQGSLTDEATLERLRQQGPFDIVLLSGGLENQPNAREIVRLAGELAGEALVIDTRVGEAGPGSNAPSRVRLFSQLDALELRSEVLPVRFGASGGLAELEAYCKGERVVIVAQRTTQLAGKSRRS